MSFFEELKRSNVFRVGIVYAVTAWILIRAFSLYLSVINAPTRVKTVFNQLLSASSSSVVLMLASPRESALFNGKFL